MNHQDIRKEVARLIDRLPRQFREQLRNVEFVVEERPSHELLLAEDLDPEEVVVANRTLERGVKLAERFRGLAVALEELPEQLLTADVLISSAGAGHYLLTADQVRAAMRRRKQKPLFLIDIAVPRDLDPSINDLDNVYLYNIDDLKEVVEANLSRRQEEAVRAERLVHAEALKFMDWLETMAVYPTIMA